MIFPVWAHRLPVESAFVLDERNELERIDARHLGCGFDGVRLLGAVYPGMKQPYREQRCAKAHRRNVCSCRRSS